MKTTIEKPERIDVDALFAAIQEESEQISINKRFKFSVKVNNLYAFRDYNSPKRYSLKSDPSFFYQEPQAREAFRVLNAAGLKAEFEKQEC